MFWNNADVDEDFILTSKVDGRPSENKIRRSLNKNTKNTKRWNLEQKYKEIQNNENWKQRDNGTCRFSGRYFYQPVTTLSLPSKPNLHQICLKNPIFWGEGNATPVSIYVICIMIQPWQWPWPCQRSDSAWPPSGIFSNNGFYVPLLIMQYASSTGEWPNPQRGGGGYS